MSGNSLLATPGFSRRRKWHRRTPDSFGSFSETFARFMGTPAFIGWMSLFIGVWLLWNVWGPPEMQFDPYPFQFLTLGLSLQASYAAPLILLAQNRQEMRDRESLENDRALLSQSRTDVDYLAREMADINLKMREVATRDFLLKRIARLEAVILESRDASVGDS